MGIRKFNFVDKTQFIQVDICNLRENFAEHGTLDTDTLDLDTRYRLVQNIDTDTFDLDTRYRLVQNIDTDTLDLVT